MLRPTVVLATSRPGLSPGDVLDGRYLLRERIGEGGMGSVFLAEQAALGRKVAIKVLHPELVDCPVQALRLREEAIAASHVRSPHCIAVIDCGALSDGTTYLVMEHVPGRPLGQIIAEGPIPLARAVDLLDQILRALAAAHDAGVIHADVKSDNFLVEEVDGADHVTMIDFGLARLASTPVEPELEDGELMVSGTPEYMAPEVARGEPARRESDLYGAGVILYELLTGAPPFDGATASDIMAQQVYDEVVPPSLRQPDRDLPPAIDRIVLRALSKVPEARFRDAATFARELRAAAGRSRAPVGAPRRARGTAPASPTRTGSTSLPGQRIARGSDVGAAERGRDLEELRRAICNALAAGDLTRIANGYLALARALAHERRFAAAAFELQEGIDVLTAGRGPAGADACAPVERLIGALEALCEESSDRRLARYIIASAEHRPTLTCAAP
ncbi:MAG TPA: serine/threonine-protein kinase [Kofleriaceae bacterium]|nr:serine/threonine-protein kinase [Kofleriaceae bacterium]